MRILAIETSCDETALAVVSFNKSKCQIINNLVASQVKIHAPYGGVVPHLASREHEKNLPLLFKKIKSDFELVALTIGPGLSPCLWQGINFAKKLKKKIIPVNHLEGHIYANAIGKVKSQKLKVKSFNFPILALIVSGGHSLLVLMEGHGKYKSLGQTRDDAAGEAFDKVAKLLKLGYPGGPLIEKMAQKGKPDKYALPRPMIKSKNYDFSFSGLKTAVLYLTRRQKIKVPDLCASFQQAVIDVLIYKTKKAIEEYKPKTVLFGGGVMANQALRQAIKSQIRNTKYQIPNTKYCLDNAVMIALAAYFKKEFIAAKDFGSLKAQPNWLLT